MYASRPLIRCATSRCTTNSARLIAQGRPLCTAPRGTCFNSQTFLSKAKVITLALYSAKPQQGWHYQCTCCQCTPLVFHTQRSVVAAADDAPSVWGKRNTRDSITVSCEYAQHRTANRVPHTQRFISAAAYDDRSIRRNTISVPCEDSQLSALHTRTVLSQLPLTMRDPSGENATLLTKSACPDSNSRVSPLLASHIRTVLSALPLAMRTPSGDIARHVTESICPTRTRSAVLTCALSCRRFRSPTVIRRAKMQHLSQHQHVLAPTHDASSVRRDSDTHNNTIVSCKYSEQGTAARVPNASPLRFRRTERIVSSSRHCATRHSFSMPCEDSHLDAAARIPHTYCLVSAATTIRNPYTVDGPGVTEGLGSVVELKHKGRYNEPRMSHPGGIKGVSHIASYQRALWHHSAA